MEASQSMRQHNDFIMFTLKSKTEIKALAVP